MTNSVKEVFELCKGEEDIFIFGGEEIYKLFLPMVEKMYITKIHEEFEGDTFFPEVNLSEWNEVSVKRGITDEKNPYKYEFYVYERAI
ncbi:dihydrofolate reductase [Bacillus sp. V2I10]|nr:dihydrofolate reductase [Bacillus sp. V2I10]